MKKCLDWTSPNGRMTCQVSLSDDATIADVQQIVLLISSIKLEGETESEKKEVKVKIKMKKKVVKGKKIYAISKLNTIDDIHKEMCRYFKKHRIPIQTTMTKRGRNPVSHLIKNRKDIDAFARVNPFGYKENYRKAANRLNNKKWVKRQLNKQL